MKQRLVKWERIAASSFTVKTGFRRRSRLTEEEKTASYPCVVNDFFASTLAFVSNKMPCYLEGLKENTQFKGGLEFGSSDFELGTVLHTCAVPNRI